jgi:anti-sigma-K factor RskA
VHVVIDLARPDERDAAAGEYVLGTLDAPDHAAFERALEGDRALQAAVYAWQDRLLALSAHADAVLPRPQLWQRIDVALNLPAPAVRSAPARPPWWQRLAPWQGLSAAAAALVLVLSVLLVQRPGVPGGARYLAVLQSPDRQSTGWVVEVQGDRLRLVPVGDTGSVPAGKALQFWTKPQGADGPTSLGLVAAGRVAELPVSRLPGVGPQQLFEITLEPEGGSPIGRPTGPILYVGRSVAL